MMEKTNYQYHLLILLFISSLLFCFPGSTTCQVYPPPPVASPPALDPTVLQICQKSLYPAFCIYTLTALPPPVPDPRALDPTVEQICQKTNYPSLCISTLAPFPSESMDSPTAILVMAMNATLNSTQVALAAATRLLSDPASTLDYNPRDAVEECQGDYSQVVQKLQTALWAVAEGDDYLVIGMLSEGHKLLEDCEDQLNTPILYGYTYYSFELTLPHDFSPIKISGMIDNCLQIHQAIHQYSY